MGITDSGIKDDAFFMQLALKQAQLAENLGEVPVGCVIVKNNEVIATGHNLQINTNDPCAHAEIIALKNAGTTMQNYRLLDTTMYVTLEPCTMCFGAIIHARISKLIFATNDLKTGVCGGCIDLSQTNCYNHSIDIHGGVLQQESQAMLKAFFKNKRKK